MTDENIFKHFQFIVCFNNVIIDTVNSCPEFGNCER